MIYHYSLCPICNHLIPAVTYTPQSPKTNKELHQEIQGLKRKLRRTEIELNVVLGFLAMFLSGMLFLKFLLE